MELAPGVIDSELSGDGGALFVAGGFPGGGAPGGEQASLVSWAGSGAAPQAAAAAPLDAAPSRCGR